MYLVQCPIYKCPCQFVQLGCPKIYSNIKKYEFPNQEVKTDIYDHQTISREKKSFTFEEAYSIGKRLGIDWDTSKFDVEQYRMGLDVELEHGMRDPATNVTNNDPILTGKIALAHLKEFPDYYTRLAKMEAEAKAYWGIK